MINSRNFFLVELTLFTLLILAFSNSIKGQPTHSQPQFPSQLHKAKVFEHWTAQRMREAQPRDFVIDAKGFAFMRKANGELMPYAHSQKPSPHAKPTGGSTDSTGPDISAMSPADGENISSSHTFSAIVTDPSNVKSVAIIILYPDGSTTQTFSAAKSGGDIWSVNLQGFTDGDWQWWVEAKDSTKRGGNSSTSSTNSFGVGSTENEEVEPPPPGIIINSKWTQGGAVIKAAGRIYFEMPANNRWKGPWNGYVCSGTVVTDETSGRSIILTAAHCAYDDAHGAFARNVLFIPNQDATTGSATDLNCSNDPMGCWSPSFAVVDRNWSLSVFPNNIPWDYAFYVVEDTGAHSGTNTSSASLDAVAGSLPLNLLTAYINDGDPGPGSTDFTHALGYSYSDDPNFMYCAEDMTTEGNFNWWLPSCGLSGGASGGPWLQPVTAGGGPVMSVNSWGYTNSPGMAGPKLMNSSASCLWVMAKTTVWSAVPDTDGYAGITQTCQ